MPCAGIAQAASVEDLSDDLQKTIFDLQKNQKILTETVKKATDIRNDEAAALAEAAREIGPAVEKEIEASAGKSLHLSDSRYSASEGVVYKRHKQALHPIGEARLLYEDLEKEAHYVSRRARIEERNEISLGKKTLGRVWEWESAERFRIAAKQRAIVDILATKYETSELAAQEGRDYRIIEKKSASGGGHRF